MFKLVILVLSSFIPYNSTLNDSFDLVEMNSFYDENGRLVFDQIIWYDWSNEDSRFQVIAWRLIRKDGTTGEITNIGLVPVRSPYGYYHSLWDDQGNIRYVTAKYFRQTWTQTDPELAEREFLPKEKRKELRTSVAKGKKKNEQHNNSVLSVVK